MDITARRVQTCSRCIRRASAGTFQRSSFHSSNRQYDLPPIEARSAANDAEPVMVTETLNSNTAGKVQSSRRHRMHRRAVLQEQLGESSVRFEDMPFQCFQAARAVLLEDRKEKLQQIQAQRARIQRLKEQEIAPQDEARRDQSLKSLHSRLEELKIRADINDPLVKKKFEDGEGDLSKPVYRHLAELKWSEHEKKIVEQRITQMNVTPDVLPHMKQSVLVRLLWKRQPRWEHGQILPARVTELMPRMRIQPFDKGTRMVSVAIVNPDVPDVETDGFTSRCHFLAVNIQISPTDFQVDLKQLVESQIAHSWIPAYSQKGLPYQRMAVIVLEQSTKDDVSPESLANRSMELDAVAIRESSGSLSRETFSLRTLMDRYRLRPVGADLYRTAWDDSTADVMHRAGITGTNVEFKRKKIEPLPYKKLASTRYR